MIMVISTQQNKQCAELSASLPQYFPEQLVHILSALS